jgi:hypothetical protein
MALLSGTQLACLAQALCGLIAGTIFSASANPQNKTLAYNASPASVFQKYGMPATKQLANPAAVFG